MSKKITVSLALTIALLAMTVTFSITMILSMRLFDSTVRSVKERELMYGKLAEIDKVVRTNFMGEIVDLQIFDMLSSGYIAGISDRNAKYYSSKQYQEMLLFQEGKIVGLGLDCVKDTTGYLRVMRVFDDSPAAEAAIEVGSHIISVNDVDVKPLSSDAANALLRGSQGTSAKLIYTTPIAEQKEQALLRKGYVTPSVSFKTENEMGFIKIYDFNKNTPSELDYALSSVASNGAFGTVIDIRNCSGQNFESAAKCADLIVGKGEIASALYPNDVKKQLYFSDDAGITTPFVVIQNQNSGGSAELFAVTLKDFGRAKLVGVKTAGKGAIQTNFRLSDGSAISIRTALLIPAKSEGFDGTGVLPDFDVLLTPEQDARFYDMSPEEDPQLAKSKDMLSALKLAQPTKLPQTTQSE